MKKEFDDWFDDNLGDEEDSAISEYQISAAPNDFNILTIYNFIESGAVRIPGFQRNYVWDIKRASKLIESIMIGLPIPQIFLYEENRNRFLVIDGQQRLMSIYYFVKHRFPREDKRTELRSIFDQEGKIPDKVLHDDAYFTDFNLKLVETLPNKENHFNKLNYSTLGENQTSFNLKTIRNIIIKQNEPQEDDSSMYEIFYRLNSGGINLKPQEIRTSLYHSDFYDMLYKINTIPDWRRLTGLAAPDIHMKDIEIILRGFAMLLDSDSYAPSMLKFLNKFSKRSRLLPKENISYLESLFLAFTKSCSKLNESAFLSKNEKFNISIFESVFTAICRPAAKEKIMTLPDILPEKMAQLREDVEFNQATQASTASTINVKKRLRRAQEILLGEAN